MKTPETAFDQKRRSFLKLSGLLGLGAASAALLPAEKAEAFLFGKKEFKVTKTKLSMGTFVAITAIHPSRDEAEQAIGLAFEEIDRLNNMLTHYDKTSPVGSFNASGKIEVIPEELQELVARSLYFNRETGGAFDITVKPLIDLYKNSFANNQTPTDVEIDSTMKIVGCEDLHYQSGTLVFGKSDMAITLDGIAKGYIVDKASTVLTKNGVANHLINAGGDIRTSGLAAQGKAWTVAVQDPGKHKEYPDVIAMRDGAIATSGSYEIYYDKEKMFHHIVDGRTGHSPHLSTSVTVMAPTVMDADALATAVFVMEPAAGAEFINRHSDYQCLIIGKDGSINRSNGWHV
ncbi:MAG: FAD:protein FMN transferase [Proteobacteria bacterium]|nr:FAD:protein FMN transferase [Pseudomonadota bacterium]